MTLSPKKPSSDWRWVALTGYAIIIATFGIVGGWAAVTKIDQAVVAPGVVAVETNRKTLQHYEGGIVREILVKEGNVVQSGQVVLRLQAVQAQANLDLTTSQLLSMLAFEARLAAERLQLDKIIWPEEIIVKRSEMLERVIRDQQAQFDERRASLRGQVDVLSSRVEQLQKQIDGTKLEKVSTEEQVAFINKELVGLRELTEKNLIPVSRVYTLERERARLEGVIGRAISDISKAEAQIGETKIQIQQLRQKFQEDTATQLGDVRQKISELREKVAVAADVLNRVEIVAPVAGSVQNMKVFTLGQVVRSGEPLMDIVPQNEPLIVNAQFSPTDIDGVYAGQDAEIRFSSFHGRMVPVMIGKLQSISYDRLMDEQTRQPYFLGVISLDRASIPEEYRPRVRSGMPADIIVALGERTVVEYIVTPLSSSLRKTFREK